MPAWWPTTPGTLRLRGTICGTGSFQQRLGTTILTAAESYGGGTTISAGTLQLDDGGTSGSITGNVTDNANFAIDRSDIYTLGGSISGTGAFQQLGTGTTILTAADTYSGGTSIAAGTLQLGSGGALTGSGNARLPGRAQPCSSIRRSLRSRAILPARLPATTSICGSSRSPAATRSCGSRTAASARCCWRPQTTSRCRRSLWPGPTRRPTSPR